MFLETQKMSWFPLFISIKWRVFCMTQEPWKNLQTNFYQGMVSKKQTDLYVTQCYHGESFICWTLLCCEFVCSVMFGKWTDHTKSWRNTDLGDRIFYVTYEEMIQVKCFHTGDAIEFEEVDCLLLTCLISVIKMTEETRGKALTVQLMCMYCVAVVGWGELVVLKSAPSQLLLGPMKAVHPSGRGPWVGCPLSLWCHCPSPGQARGLWLM